MLINELRYSKERAQFVVKQFDRNGDGKLSSKEFERFKSSVKQTKKDLMAVFTTHDTNNDGFISFEEASVFLQEPPFNFPPEKIKALMSRFDRDGNAHLDYNEFLSFYPEAKATQEEIMRQFDHLDVHRSGKLSVEELVHVIQEITGYDELNARQFILSIDANNDGFIDRKEFTEMWSLMFG
jgi:Ca2+-binding EF-hand superfamily protein